MSLTTGRGPLGQDPSGWFTPAVPSPVVFVEPHHRRVKATIGNQTVIDTERALLVHRVGAPLNFAFPADLVRSLPSTPVPEARGYATVPWDSVDNWFEEGRKLVHYPANPYHRVDCRPTDRAIRVTVRDVALVDTANTVILFETSLAPVLYVDRSEVRMDLLEPSRSDKTTYCNYKGIPTYFSARIGDTVVEDVAWSYEDPLPESLPIKNLLAFDRDRTEILAELPDASDNIDDCGCSVG